MANDVQSNAQLKSYFETGDRPTQSQFSALIDRISYGNYVNVVDYGVSAGNPDNAVAIKAAISGGTGQTLYFPGSSGDGEVYLTSKVSSNMSYTIAGDGIGKSIIKLISSADDDMFYADGVNNISFANITLDGNRSLNKRVGESGNAFQYLSCDNLNFNNIQIQNFPYIGTRFSGCSDVIVYGSKVKNCIGGWYFSGRISGSSISKTSERVRLTDCIVSASLATVSEGDQFAFDNGNYDCSWNNCISINSHADGFIVFSNKNTPSQRISIDNCKVYNAANNGMSFHSCNDITITGPIISGTGISPTSSASATGFGNGIDISNNETNQTEISRITITGAVMNNIQKHGVRILDSQSTEVKNISINDSIIINVGTSSSNSYDCVNINNCQDIMISNCRMAAGPTGRDGIRVNSSAIRTFINNNNILGALGTDITNNGNSSVIFHQKNTGASMIGVTNPADGYSSSGSLTLPSGAVIRSLNTPKSLAHVFWSGGVPVSGGLCFNVSGFTDNGTGDVTIKCTTTISEDANNTFWFAQAFDGTKNISATIRSYTTNSVRVVTHASGVPIDPEALFVEGYGL